MDMKNLKGSAVAVAWSAAAVRRLCMGVLTGWGLIVFTVLAWGGTGTAVVWLTGPFVLCGVGLGLVVVVFWEAETAFRLTVVVGGGLGAVTVISQTLMMVGAFDPVTVVGVENGLLLLLWAWMEWAQWSTRS
ncbi:hypothetical protein ABDK96_11840 [Citricoccus nitrophenolicus]|uniref:Uncharacterized protein n=1 Tax=Citricoccus nitrophenolicus TaxID=863575 RepID=A0ABV0IJN3_9MICC